MPLDHDAELAVRESLSSKGVPSDVTGAFVGAVSDVIDHFVAGRLRPSELSGGDFVEAAFRVLQFLAQGTFTDLGRTLPRVDRLVTELESSSLDDALRVHVPRLLRTIYDIRNRRGVGHLPGPISANRADAELIVGAIKWILCEFIRLFHTTSHDEAQRVIDRLVVSEVLGVEDFEGTLRLITTVPLSIPDSVILLLAAAGLEANRGDLSRWVRSPGRQFSTALGRLDDRNLIHRFSDGRVRLTTLGLRRADELRHRLQTA